MGSWRSPAEAQVEILSWPDGVWDPSHWRSVGSWNSKPWDWMKSPRSESDVERRNLHGLSPGSLPKYSSSLTKPERWGLWACQFYGWRILSLEEGKLLPKPKGEPRDGLCFVLALFFCTYTRMSFWFFIIFLTMTRNTEHENHHLKNFEVYNSVAFSIFTVLCGHHCHLVLEHFHQSQKETPPWTDHSPSLLFQDPSSHWSAFCLCGLAYSGSFI